MSGARPVMDVATLLRVVGKPLTEEQLAAVTAPMEPTVVVAGAGTGKTTVMAARVLWLVGTGQVQPGEVLGLTFTNKAAGELAARVRQTLRTAGLLGGTTYAPGQEVDVEEPAVLTYHAYAGRLLREHGLRIGVEPGARLLADATRFQLATRVLARYDRPLSEVSHSLPVVVDSTLALDGELAEHLVSTDAARTHDRALVAAVDAWLAEGPKHFKETKTMRATALKRLELLDVVDAMRAERARLETIDFSDQMRLAAQLVSEAPSVAEQQRDTYRVVLLDEYQDTSVAQRVLLQALFDDGHPVTAVGDPCQAIYGWRGASVRNIDAFPTDFPRADGTPATRLALSVNNRSDSAILDVANALSGPLREIHPGVAALAPRADRVDAGRVVTALHASHAAEITWVADQVARLVHEEGVDPDQVAILVRVNREVAGLRDLLVARDVPVDVAGLGGLLDVPEVADVVATLEVLDDPTANPALVRLLSGPRWRIGPRDLRLLGKRAAELAGDQSRAADSGVAGGESDDGVGCGEDVEARLRIALEDAVAGVDPAEVLALVDAVEDPGPWPFSSAAKARFGGLAAELRALRRHHGDSAADLVARIVAVSGLDVEVAAQPHGDGGAALAQLADVAAQFSDVDGGTGVHAFLAFTRAARRFDRGLEPPADATTGGVKLLTAHKAKGLEFAVVFVPMLSRGVFPSTRGRPSWTTIASTVPASLRGDAEDRPVLGGMTPADHKRRTEEDREQAELEERRLIYVAATRAEHLLVMSGHWWGPTQRKARGPSSYLLDALAHCDAVDDERGTVAVRDESADEGENPFLTDGVPHEWPAPLDPDALAARRAVAAAVTALRGTDVAPEPAADVVGLAESELAMVQSWDRDLDALLDEARAASAPVREVVLPSSLSATTALRLASDPAGLAADLARPMPRPPAPAAARGTRFHAWVEEHFRERQLDLGDLMDPTVDAVPGSIDLDEAGDDAWLGGMAVPTGPDDLASLKAAFLAGPFADRSPAHVELPFGISLGGLVVRGRIDAVYRERDGRYLVVDWKTGRSEPDPVQLAIYRVAFAELNDLSLDRVGAAFYTVPTGEVHVPTDLPDRAELEARLLGA